MMYKKFFILIIFPAILIACQHKKSSNHTALTFTTSDSLRAQQYNIFNYFSVQEADTLLVDAVTFIGRKPVIATSETRFDPEFRAYYKDYAQQFSFFLYHIDADSVHTFYMLRPARSLDGNTRGVLGQFRLDSENGMHHFVEILNTRVSSRQALKKIGLMLFDDLLHYGHVDYLIGDTAMVEWPDGRLKYDRIRNEWRYDVD